MANELRVDLTVCADGTAQRFRVIEVAYANMGPVPCYTYLSVDERAVDASPPETEQITWSSEHAGVCEAHARQLRQRFERDGYFCLLHKEDQRTIRQRVAAIYPAPIEINLLGAEGSEPDESPSNFSDQSVRSEVEAELLGEADQGDDYWSLSPSEREVSETSYRRLDRLVYSQH